MKIRLISRVHYQVSRPGIFTIIIQKCSSKNLSTYPENIALKLLKLSVKNPDSDFNNFLVNKESVKFAVSMAQSLELLTSNCIWDWRGYVIAKVIEELDKPNLDSFLNLSKIEKILYLKYFLEADGAAIVEFSKILFELGKVSRNTLLKEHNDIINQAFINIWESYRKLSSTLIDKMNMAENIKNLKSRPYTYKTLIHKAQAHIFPLVDLGIINRIKEENNEVSFSIYEKDGKSYIKNLLDELITIENMETRFSRFEYFKIIANVYDIKYIEYIPNKHFNVVSSLIINTYHNVKDNLTQLSSIAVISDIVSAKLLADNKIMVEKLQIEEIMIILKSQNPTKVHFHVDKYGNRAFVILNL